jgi:hypothetical protein
MTDDAKPMDEKQLAAALREFARGAANAEDSELSKERQKSLEYYKGEVNDVPTQEGWSKVTSRDMSEVIHWILPSLMRVFAASDVIAEFEPRTPGEQSAQAAKEATQYLNHLFMVECDGYKILHNNIFDGLLNGNGFGKVWFDPTPVYDVEDYSGLTEEEYLAIGASDDVEILQKSERDEDGIILYDCKLRITKTRGRFRIEETPAEEIIVKDGAETLYKSDYVGHRYKEKRGVLAEMEWSNPKAHEIIMRAPAESNFNDTEEYQERHDDYEPLSDQAVEDKASEEIEVIEHYVRVDFDGDGWPEWRKVVTVGNISSEDILANDEWSDDHCFYDIVPDPQPHIWIGRSIRHLIEDIQQQKTVLMRGINDNMALVNHPDRVVNKSVHNKDVLANPKPGRIVYVDGDVRAAMADVVTPYIGQQAFQVIGYYDEQRERRTGVSRQSMALDPDAMQNQTATAANIQETASQAQNELRARNVAQYGGITRLFQMLYRLARRHLTDEMTVKTNNGFITINPRMWPSDMDVVVTVGLGSGSRDKDLNTLNAISMKQEQILAQLGPSNPLVNLGQYSNTLTKLAETSGIRNPEMFFNKLTPQDMQAYQQQMSQQPNPEAQKAQAEMQKAQMEMQMKAQEAQVNAQIREKEIAQKTAIQREESAQRLQLERERMAADIQNQRDKYQLEGELARQKAAQEFELKREEMAIEAELTREANRLNAAMNAQRAADTNIERQAGE